MRQGLSRINSELTLLEGKARPPARGSAELLAAYEARQNERNASALDARDVSLLSSAIIFGVERKQNITRTEAVVLKLRVEETVECDHFD